MRLRMVALWAVPVLLSRAAVAQDWPAYGNDPAGTRYSPLSQINAGNVARLAQAWAYDTRPSPAAKAARVSQATPLVIGGVMYLVTAHQSLVALDPETGKKLWEFTHPHQGRPPRGVAYWPGDRNSPPTIYFGTWDGFLLAVNAKTGKAVPGFAKEGSLDLKPGVKDGYAENHYGLSGAPAVFKNLIITGSHSQDSPSKGGKGDVRAWDAHTGKLVWTFHTVPRPGEAGHETWLNDGWQERSGANVWSTFTLDNQTGMLFLPLGSASYDIYGGDRPGANLFANSLVALDAATGKRRWHFQTVHHDLWDYDLPPQPTLAEITRNGRKIPVVVQAGKTGLVFILDRRDGKPIHGVEERPVPKGDVPGEWYSPTQPFPLKPPPLARLGVKREEIAKVTPEHQKFCEELWDSSAAHNDGAFTPTGAKNTVIFPGSLGGANWGGGTVDPSLGYFFINVRNSGQIGRMLAWQGSGLPPKNGLGEDLTQNAYVRTGPRSQNIGFTNPANGWPCQEPPWGELFAIDLNTGDIAWRIPFGRIEELEARGVMNTGSVNLGGSVATAGGLLFIGATDDRRFHAYESKTGKLLWEARLEAPAIANPVTYRGKNGKQYVAVQAGETFVAFSLP
jgi:quinoprotein glucose dehydrogenase